MPPSRLGLLAGSALTAEEAILALVTKSANDAAAALGEHLGGGSEVRFAQLMTLRARSLGMTRSTFRNASGLPDLEQLSTARDMALLGRRLVLDFPDRYPMFSTPNFVHRGRTHWNHNRLLAEYDGTDGIKTGYVNDSGFNLVASTQRDGVRLVAAVFGGRTGRERDRHMVALLDQGFAQMGVAPRVPAPVMAARPERPVAGRGFAGRSVAWLGSARAATPTRTASIQQHGRPLRMVVAPQAGRNRTAGLLAGAGHRRPGPAASRPRLEQGDGGGRGRAAAASGNRGPKIAVATRANSPESIRKRR